MKKTVTIFRSAKFLGLLVLLGVLGACHKSSNSTTPASTTISAIVSGSSNFTLLNAALTKAGLTTTLNGAGPYTVFAPDDSAFAASGISSDVINTLSVSSLQSILLYHVLPGKIDAASVPAGPDAKVITASGDSVFVTNNSNGVFVNGVKVKTADVAASNGIIHVLSAVLIPANGNNIVQELESDTSFSYLVAAVVRASTGSTNVAAVLSGSGPFTVFAPTNNAFRAAGFATTDAINAADPNTLTSILTYHVVAGRVFSSDLTDGEQPATVNGEKLTIGLQNGATVKGNSNTTASNIIKTNAVATNGVIHVIDQVLLP